MMNSNDTADATAFQQITAENTRANPSPASKEEREAHYFAWQAARESGEKLKWNDERRHRWPKKDRINWVAQRLAESETEISKCGNEREKKSLEQTREDYITWMLKEDDNQSWSKIARSRMERIGIPKQESYAVSEAFEMQARRAYERAERNHPGSALFKPEPLRFENYCPNCGYPWL